MAAHSTLERFTAGTVVVAYQEQGSSMYIVKEGVFGVSVPRMGRAWDERELAVLKKGMYVGVCVCMYVDIDI